jgi:hypothetical protein
VPQGTRRLPRRRIGVRASGSESWPFTIVLILTIGGVAYTTFSKQPMAIYWEILAPIIGLVCIGAGP